jgi:hypothetical protein
MENNIEKYDWGLISIHSINLDEDFIWKNRTELDIQRVIWNNKEHLTKDFILRLLESFKDNGFKFKRYNISSFSQGILPIEEEGFNFFLFRDLFDFEVEELAQFIMRDSEGKPLLFGRKTEGTLKFSMNNFSIFDTLYRRNVMSFDFILEYFDCFECLIDYCFESDQIFKRRLKTMRFKGYDMRKSENNNLRLFMKLKGRM